MTYNFREIVSLLKIHSFSFENIPSRLQCIICLSFLKNAHQTSCGCKVCEQCIYEYLLSGPKPCPSRQPECANSILKAEDIYRDNATIKEINNFIMKCPFRECNVSIPLKEMAKHIEKCEFQRIVCEGCKQMILMSKKNSHEKEMCEMRLVSCEYCDEKIVFKDLKEIHLNCDNDKMCAKFTSICPNVCGVEGKLNIKDHMETCSKRKLHCPFHSLNCNVRLMPKERLIKHLRDEIIQHSSILVERVSQLQETLQKVTCELQNQEQLNNELKLIVQKSIKSCVDTGNIIEKYGKRDNSLVQRGQESEIFRKGNFIWKISDFERKRIEAENGIQSSITSEAFYTSEFGYKMCLRIYPAGDGIGKGTHLSVFFAIMKGDFDDILSWPFGSKITLSIIDQENATRHFETLKPDKSSICYQKPTSECNVASGSPKFISLSLLGRDSSFRKNNTIYIKISVDSF